MTFDANTTRVDERGVSGQRKLAVPAPARPLTDRERALRAAGFPVVVHRLPRRGFRRGSISRLSVEGTVIGAFSGSVAVLAGYSLWIAEGVTLALFGLVAWWEFRS